MTSKKRVFIAGGIAVWVILAVVADRALAGSGSSVETDDAYVTAHYSIVAPKDVSGLIDRVDVNDNQYVHAGQELAHIDDRDYRTAVASAAAALAGAKADLAILAAQIAQQMATINQAKATVQADDAALELRPGECRALPQSRRRWRRHGGAAPANDLGAAAGARRQGARRRRRRVAAERQIAVLEAEQDARPGECRQMPRPPCTRPS